eukprot:15355947-Ditylum_brightwellii.AAC.2
MAAKELALIQFNSVLITHKTAPLIWNVIVYRVWQWLNMPTNYPPWIPNDPLEGHLTTTIEAQHMLGWDDFLKGRTNIFFQHAQMIHIQTFHFHLAATNAKTWALKKVVATWKLFNTIWQAHNECLYTAQETEEISIMDSNVEHVYKNLSRPLLTNHLLLFHLPLEQRLQTMQTAKKNWPRFVDIAIQDYIKIKIITQHNPKSQTFSSPEH